MGKYALTEHERKWLEERKKKNTRLCTTCQNHAPWYVRGKLVKLGCRTDSGEACPFYRSSHTLDDYRDAAEFEARVSRCIAENASELDMISNNLQFLDGFKAKSLAWYILREARIAVEEKMDECLSPRL